MATSGGEDPSGSASSSASALDSLPFSSGNPRIEETRGVVLLHPEPPAASSSSLLPVGRKPRVCVPGVPNHLTYADFGRFCASWASHILETRIIRIDGVEDQYGVLIKFDTQSFTDSFYMSFNGNRFSSLEGNVCRVRFVEDVHYTQLIEHAHSSVTSSAEQPTCPNDLTKILEAFLQQYATILSTIRACQSGQTLRAQYCQQEPEKSSCSVCGTSENLWICVICGHVGCGRYKGGHAIEHWKETQHCYSLELETQKVWDYAGDNYVHRLIQSKTDGNLVEYNFYGDHSVDGMCSTCNGDAGISEALLDSKMEAIVEEYNDLVTSQLEKQRNYYESLLLEVKEDNEKEIAAATEKAVGIKVQKLQAKLDKCMEETRFLNDIHENLVKNMEMWRERIQKVKEREQAAIRLKDEKIEKLEEELRDLIAHFERQNTVAEASESMSSDINGSTILSVPSESSASSNSSIRN
uniref:UBP-type domain-containing protein n=1 Tax=Oryza glumipatula TaxID=40148 RepID=A0A0D9YNC4_9ORYZ